MSNEIATKVIKKPKSIMKWSWIFIVTFFVLSFIDERFGLLGFICMMVPIGLSLSGKGKRHCSHYCPRGSFFGKFLGVISLNKKLPKFMSQKGFKSTFLILMFVRFGYMIYELGFNYEKIGYAMFRFMFQSFILGVLIGIVFVPRSWCRICPMGHASGLIRDAKLKKSNS